MDAYRHSGHTTAAASHRWRALDTARDGRGVAVGARVGFSKSFTATGESLSRRSRAYIFGTLRCAQGVNGDASPSGHVSRMRAARADTGLGLALGYDTALDARQRGACRGHANPVHRHKRARTMQPTVPISGQQLRKLRPETGEGPLPIVCWQD
eukprot:4092711-Prymnesium_polylepis.1